MRDPELVAAQLDTATFRVVAHVTVIELVGQNAMTASQALHEDHMDTFYAFTYRAFDAITVSTVYLIRQFVRFPNLIIASSPLVKEAYEKYVGQFEPQCLTNPQRFSEFFLYFSLGGQTESMKA